MSAKANRDPKSPPTVRDIARVAGVAVGSVSRALNGHPDLNPDLRERILSAARELDYAPLRRKRAATPGRRDWRSDAGSIGLICFGMEETLVQLPVVSSAVHGIEEAISMSGGTFMFANIPQGDRVPAFLSEKRVSGVILKGPNVGLLPPESESELLRAIYRLPHVWLLGKLPNAHGDHCNFDHEMGGRLVAHHLREKGHVHVAFMNPKPGHAQFEPLKSAFIYAAKQAGMKVDVLEPSLDPAIKWPLPAISSQTTIEGLVREWAKPRPAQRATAIAVGADSAAVQLYSALGRIGVRPGKDVGVISCNDERSLIMSLNPALTTINVNAEVVGRNAVARLAWRLAHENEENCVRILVEPKLIVRDSVPTRRN